MLILIDVSWIIIITLYTFLLTHLRFFFVLIWSDKIANRTNATATPSLVPPIHLKKNSIHVRTLFRANWMFLSFFYFYKTSVCPGKAFLEFLYHLSPVTNRIKTFHLSRAMFLSRLSFVSYWSRCYWWHRHIVQQRITTTIVFTSDLLRQQDEHWYFSSDIFFRCSFDTFYSKFDHP